MGYLPEEELSYKQRAAQEAEAAAKLRGEPEVRAETVALDWDERVFVAVAAVLLAGICPFIPVVCVQQVALLSVGVGTNHATWRCWCWWCLDARENCSRRGVPKTTTSNVTVAQPFPQQRATLKLHIESNIFVYRRRTNAVGQRAGSLPWVLFYLRSTHVGMYHFLRLSVSTAGSNLLPPSL